MNRSWLFMVVVVLNITAGCNEQESAGEAHSTVDILLDDENFQAKLELNKVSSMVYFEVEITNKSGSNVLFSKKSIGLDGDIPDSFEVIEVESRNKEKYIGLQGKVTTKSGPLISHFSLYPNDSITIKGELSKIYNLNKSSCYEVVYVGYFYQLEKNAFVYLMSDKQILCTK